MSIVVVGMSHKTAPLSIREKIYFSPHDSKSFQELQKVKGVEEGLILSTCNRVEVCAAMQEGEGVTQNLSRFLTHYHGYPPAQFSSYVYQHKGKSAIHHIFRVASSLDSMVVGESQILGQVKAAYRTSQEAKVLGPQLHRFFNRAFFVAKRVRTETTLGSQPVSVGSVAAQLCQKIFKELTNKHILLIGAGEMVEAILDTLIQRGVQTFYIANRSKESVIRLQGQLQGKLQERFKQSSVTVHYLSFEELDRWLFKMDVILASTNSQSFLLTRAMMEKAIQQRKQNPIFCVDISVPRNIDPEVHNIDNIYLYNIDDLQETVKENLKHRALEALKAERIVQEEGDKFYEKMHHWNTRQSTGA